MTDPRIRQLAKRRQDMAYESGSGLNPSWEQLGKVSQTVLLSEAEEWLRAAVEAGLMPLADRPTDKHDAILLDNHGQIWGEYQTSPSSHGDAILRLVWEREVCSSKRELEERGVEFRLIGWSE